MANLSPDFVQQLLALLANGGSTVQDGYGYFGDYSGGQYASPESGMSGSQGALSGISRVPMDQAKSSRMVEEFGTDGAFQGTRQDTYTNPLADLAKFAAMAAGVQGAGMLADGSMGSLFGGATGTAGGTSLGGGIGQLASGIPGGSAALPMLETMGTLPANLAGSVAAIPALSGSSGFLDGLKSLTQSVGGLGSLAGPLGGLLGAATSQDKTMTSSAAPWEAAQPLLKGLLGTGEQLAGQIGKETPNQQTAYGNLYGLLNTMNTQAPGRMAGFGANASGANNYDRANPRRALTGGTFDLSSFLPGLFGGGK